MGVDASQQRASVIATPRFDSWSTAAVPPSMRLEYWREAVSQAMMTCSVSAADRDSFSGRITSRRFNDFTFNYFESSGHQVVRTERDIRHGSDRRFVLSVQLSGQARVEQCGRTVDLVPQSMGLADAGKPVTVTLFGEVRCIAAVLPYSLVLRHLPRARPIGALQVDPAHPCADIIREYLKRLSQPHPAIEGVAGDVMSAHLCELLGIVASSQLGAESAPSSSRQIRKAMLLAYLRRNALDAELTPGVCAKALGMSVRSVHNLMQDFGQSFTEWVLVARVNHARRLLQSTGAERCKIADVAAACGFSDLSHFNRMFKARVGCTPSGARALSSPCASS